MTQRTRVILAAASFLIATVPQLSRGDIRRQRPLRRPYIVEIGEPYAISIATLDTEADQINELSNYLQEYGYPDYAEIQEVNPDWPWESYEVRLYYMRRNMELDFGHVLVSEAISQFGVMKFQGGISAQKRHEIEIILQAQAAPAAAPPAAAVDTPSDRAGRLNATVARIEAAAERAAQAADRAAEQSEAAERAANRTVNVVEKLSENPNPAPRHHH